MNSMKDAMMHAIKNRRGNGLDIKIILEGAGKPEDKSEEMAPEAPTVDEGQGKELSLEDMMAASPDGDAGPSMEDTDKEIFSSIDDGEPMDHKPRSLGERAKMALMQRMGKK